MKWPSHGANPHTLYGAMNIPLPSRLIDLSANINPLGPPKILKESWHELFNEIGNYPDPEATFLKKAIIEREGIPQESILIGNGGAELITLLGRFLARKNVMIVQPSFSEYEQACQANECHIFYHHLDENWELNLESFLQNLDGKDAVFLCNPNNPTGVCFPYETVSKLAETCEKKGIYLVVDEAFHDFWKNYQSLTPLLQNHSMVILLRSLTKMYAIPGLRLGYVLADKNVINELSKHQPHWSVNAIAIKAGEKCLRDEEHVLEAIEYIEDERGKLFAYFKREDFEVSPSQVNFYLLRDQRLQSQLPLFKFLLDQGIVPRHTMNFSGLEGKWLRFAIKSNSENNFLLEALKKWRS